MNRKSFLKTLGLLGAAAIIGTQISLPKITLPKEKAEPKPAPKYDPQTQGVWYPNNGTTNIWIPNYCLADNTTLWTISSTGTSNTVTLYGVATT
jgi:hypothetical protein